MSTLMRTHRGIMSACASAPHKPGTEQNGVCCSVFGRLDTPYEHLPPNTRHGRDIWGP